MGKLNEITHGYFSYVTSIAFVIMIQYYILHVKGSVEELCQNESYEAECSQDSVVLMTSALYGRMRVGKCVTSNLGNIGCASDVISYFDKICSGKRQCNVNIPNFELNKLNVNCPTEYTPYVETSHVCKKVLPTSRQTNECRENGAVIVKEPEGTISSSAFYRSIPQDGCKFILLSEVSQRINISMTSFDHSDSELGVGVTNCGKYFTLLENTMERPMIVCDRNKRKQHVHQSSTNRLEIELTRPQGSTETLNFLIIFSFVGCSEPPLNGHSIVSRTDLTIMLKCHSTGESTELQCQGQRWNKQLQQCDGNQEGQFSLWRILAEEWTTTKGLAISMGIGIGIGASAGLLMLFCIMACIRRKSDSTPQQHYLYNTSYPTNQLGGEELTYNACARTPLNIS